MEKTIRFAEHLYNKVCKGLLWAEHYRGKPGKEGEVAGIQACSYCDYAWSTGFVNNLKAIKVIALDSFERSYL